MNLLITLAILGTGVTTLGHADGRDCDQKIIASAASDIDRQNVHAVVKWLRTNNYLALTDQISGRKSIEVVPVHLAQPGPYAKAELFTPGPYRIKVSNIDPQSEASIWAVASALAQIEVAARVRVQAPLVNGHKAPWIQRPKITGAHRGEQVPPVINEIYRLLNNDLKSLDAAEVLPSFDPAIKWKTVRAVMFGSPRTGPNGHDYKEHYRREGRGEANVTSVLQERFERELLIGAWREQTLRAGFKVVIFGMVATPLVFYGAEHLPQPPPPPAQVMVQSTDVVEAPTDPRARAAVYKELQGLIDELKRRKAENIRFPNTEYINEAKQAIVQFYSDHAWLFADTDPRVPRA